jgi:hypothetical protein
VKKLGSGQFGDVFKAKQGDQTLAVKFLQKATEEALSEIVEELSLLG